MQQKIAEILLCTILIPSLLLTLSEAYSGLIPPDPENPGKCIYRGDTLKSGINSGTAPCQRLTCNDDGSVLIEGCGKLWIENCNRGERIHTEKPYPDCCKLRYKCKKADGTPYYMEKDASDDANKTENKA